MSAVAGALSPVLAVTEPSEPLSKPSQRSAQPSDPTNDPNDEDASEDASDEAAERAWRAGSQEAFGLLFRRHYPGVVAYAQRFTGELASAEDVAQQAFINILQRRDGRGRFKSLVYTVVRNLALNERRRRGRRYVAKHGLDDIDPAGAETSPIRRLIAGEEQAAFAAALARLPEDVREAFCLKETRGLTYGEVGRIMGLHPDAVRRRVSKAIAGLRRLLRPASGAAEGA